MSAFDHQQIDGTFDPSLYSGDSLDGIKSLPSTPAKDASLKSTSPLSNASSGPNANAVATAVPSVPGTTAPPAAPGSTGSVGSSSSSGNGESPADSKAEPEPPKPEFTKPAKAKPPPKFCEMCGKVFEGKNKAMLKIQHLAQHFKHKLFEDLPNKSAPFACPVEGCSYQTKHKPDWARHYGSVHKFIDKYLKEYLAENPMAKPILKQPSEAPAPAAADNKAKEKEAKKSPEQATEAKQPQEQPQPQQSTSKVTVSEFLPKAELSQILSTAISQQSQTDKNFGVVTVQGTPMRVPQGAHNLQQQQQQQQRAEQSLPPQQVKVEHQPSQLDLIDEMLQDQEDVGEVLDALAADCDRAGSSCAATGEAATAGEPGNLTCFMCDDEEVFDSEDALNEHISANHFDLTEEFEATGEKLTLLSTADVEATLVPSAVAASAAGEVAEANQVLAQEATLQQTHIPPLSHALPQELAAPVGQAPQAGLVPVPPTGHTAEAPSASATASTAAATAVDRRSGGRPCEICGYEPKTKNKSRERSDHLAMKHYKERIERDLAQIVDQTCPICGFRGKDKQTIYRHYTGKHRVVEKYLADDLASGKVVPLNKQQMVQARMTQQVTGAPVPQAQGPNQVNMTPLPPLPSFVVQEMQEKNGKKAKKQRSNSTAAPKSSTSTSGAATAAAPNQASGGTTVEMQVVTANARPAASTDDMILNPVTGLLQPAPSAAGRVKAGRDKIMQVDGCFDEDEFEDGSDEECRFEESCSEEEKEEEESIMQVDGNEEDQAATTQSNGESHQHQREESEQEPKQSSKKGKKKKDENEDSIDQGNSSGRSGGRLCQLCGEHMKSHVTYHYAIKHFKDRLTERMPETRPYKCPECPEYEAKTKINMWTHFLGKHGYLKRWMAEELEKKEKNGDGGFPPAAAPSFPSSFGTEEPLCPAQAPQQVPAYDGEAGQMCHSALAPPQTMVAALPDLGPAALTAASPPMQQVTVSEFLPKTEVEAMVVKGEPAPSVVLIKEEPAVADTENSCSSTMFAEAVSSVTNGVARTSTPTKPPPTPQAPPTPQPPPTPQAPPTPQQQDASPAATKQRGRKPGSTSASSSSSSAEGPFWCDLCQAVVRIGSQVSHFVAAHFQERLREARLPQEAPFCCTLCRLEAKTYSNLCAHYVSRHPGGTSFMQKWLREDLEVMERRVIAEAEAQRKKDRDTAAPTETKVACQAENPRAGLFSDDEDLSEVESCEEGESMQFMHSVAEALKNGLRNTGGAENLLKRKNQSGPESPRSKRSRLAMGTDDGGEIGEASERTSRDPV